MSLDAFLLSYTAGEGGIIHLPSLSDTAFGSRMHVLWESNLALDLVFFHAAFNNVCQASVCCQASKFQPA